VSSPRVSIALATCQGERFLDAQLESIARQTRPPDQLIVNDDASRDGSWKILQAFAERAAFRVEAEQNTERLGITRNFERAVSRCGGDVIFFADQDDVWEPDKIETLLQVLEERPETGAVFHDGRIVDETLAPLDATLWDSLGFDARERRLVGEGHAADVFLRHVVAAGTTMAFRAQYAPLVLPFPALRSCHDAFTAFLISAVANVEIVDRPLIRYRLHGANQIGIQKLGLRGQLEKAREQLATGAFAYAAEFFEVARERLVASSFEVDAATMRSIVEKILHSRRRASMAGSFLGRLHDVIREAGSGRYSRYSYGIKSIAQDLWLR
jgi:glycosyltransferase involved in cell wall biosynthesis